LTDDNLNRDDPLHLPRRPEWTCDSDGQAWPCEAARKEMSAAYDSITLPILTWAYLEELAADKPGMPLGEMFRRLLAWTGGR
jgi:hypothetical protein